MVITMYQSRTTEFSPELLSKTMIQPTDMKFPITRPHDTQYFKRQN